MFSTRIACLSFFCALLAGPAVFAGTLCASGTLASLIGTTCDIGSLQFTFSGLQSQDVAYDYSTSSYLYNSAWAPSDFTLTPVTNGFALSFDGGAQSFTAPADGYVNDYAYLQYSVLDLVGNITGETATGGALSGSVDYYAEIIGETSGLGNSGSFFQMINGQFFEGGDQLTYLNYTGNSYGPPFSSSGPANAYPFDLGAVDGSRASWEGAPTTITYTLSSASVPEPGAFLMLGTGLLALGANRKWKFLS